ncbi:MAG TPA: cache domain-containing protein [Anaerolineales bacterium]|nr:cache domain-containing protein [Anaerolineales bacterium]
MKDSSSKTPAFMRSSSLRTRLTLGNIIVTFIAVAALGYYVYYRAQQTNSYLTSQLASSVRQQAETQLDATSAAQAATLNNFFASAVTNITLIGSTADNLLSAETRLDNGSYWDAAKSMARLPSGSWDNSPTDVASVFIPAKIDLTPDLTAELNTVRQLDFTVPSILKANPDVVAIYFGGASGETLYYPNIDLATIVPADFDVTGRPWYTKASPEQNPARRTVWSDPYLDAASHGLIVTSSVPVYNSLGDFRGVAAMDFQLNRITSLVSNVHVGDTGYAFLLDQNYRLIGMPDAGYKEFGISTSAVPLGQVLAPSEMSAQVPAEFWQVLAKMSSGQSGLETIELNGVEHFMVYQPLPSVGYSLAILVPSEELLKGAATAQAQIVQSTRNTLIFSILLVLGILIISLLASLAISGALTSPLASLTKTAEEITAGNLNATARIDARNEIGTLANALNTMTSTLKENIQSLEQRVAERTSALEESYRKADRRAAHFEAIALIVKAINSIHQMDALLPQITSVISEHFGYYHVGIFLNNESDQTAVLTSSNSEGGRRMLERNHRLKIGEQGIVGYVASTGKTRIARNVGEDSAYFNNPDLPETLSEMAVPLRTGNKIVGVLDVQSKQADAFSQEDIGVLSLLADEVSLAIDNTRLFETTNKSLAEAEALYRQYLRQAWNRLPREERLHGYRYTISGSAPLERPLDLEGGAEGSPSGTEENPPARLVVPIKLRGEVIGNLVIQNPHNKEWSQDQLDLARAVADRVALSAENARLFDETSRRAERERMVTEITSKIRSTNNPDEMVSIALNELRGALGATQVQLIPQVISAPKDERTVKTSIAPQKADPAHSGNGAKK